MLISWEFFSECLPHPDVMLFPFILVASASLNANLCLLTSIRQPRSARHSLLGSSSTVPQSRKKARAIHTVHLTHFLLSGIVVLYCNIWKGFFFFNYILFSFLVVYGRKVMSGLFTPITTLSKYVYNFFLVTLLTCLHQHVYFFYNVIFNG